MHHNKIILKKNRLIIFEGIDRSGKTSLRLELLKRIPNILTIDRLTASNYIYAKYFNRHNEDMSYLIYLEEVLSTRAILVYCFCNYEEYLKRCKNTSHEVLSKKEFQLQRGLYDYYLKYLSLYNKIISFDTTAMSIKSCTDILIRYILNIDKKEK